MIAEADWVRRNRCAAGESGGVSAVSLWWAAVGVAGRERWWRWEGREARRAVKAALGREEERSGVGGECREQWVGMWRQEVALQQSDRGLGGPRRGVAGSVWLGEGSAAS